MEIRELKGIAAGVYFRSPTDAPIFSEELNRGLFFHMTVNVSYALAENSFIIEGVSDPRRPPAFFESFEHLELSVGRSHVLSTRDVTE